MTEKITANETYKPSSVFVMGGLGDSVLSNVEWSYQLSQIRQFSVEDITPQKDSVNERFSFSDRVKIITDAVEKRLKDYPHEEIVLIGQSAGGLAVLKAAEILGEKVSKVITSSPAMPKGISPISIPLLKKLWKYIPEIFRGKVIGILEKDYKYIISPNKGDVLNPLILDELEYVKAPISGKEAAELGNIPTNWQDFIKSLENNGTGLQPEIDFVKIKAKAVMISGGQDRWVNPSGHNKLAEKMQSIMGNRFVYINDEKSGHMITADIKVATNLTEEGEVYAVGSVEESQNVRKAINQIFKN
jgi:alpha-beta hydrolase superfamily lysophospholipase